jgi:predicted RNA methylase
VRASSDVLAVLSRCGINGHALTLPGQLDRCDYLAVNKIIEAAGGKWDRKARAHLFADPAEPIIETILLTGEIVSRKQELQFFETPPEVAETLIGLASLSPSLTVLEPSAGDGAIVNAVAPLVSAVVAVEIDHLHAENLLRQAIYCLHEGDFLALEPDGRLYDRVIMNPPFARQQDVAHVTHALKFLRPGGLLVSVMSLGTTFRQNRIADDFRKLVAGRGGEFVPLPDDAFKVSGTGVKTVIVTIPSGVAL